MSTQLENRVEALLQKYYQEQALVQPKISALEAKIRELKNGVRADGNEHREIMTQLKELSNPNQFDGNGVRINPAPYLKLIRQIESLPVTAPTPTGANKASKQNQVLGALQEIIDGALFEDERAREVTHQVKTMVENKRLSVMEATIILNLFLYEPVGSNGRATGEARFASVQYN